MLIGFRLGRRFRLAVALAMLAAVCFALPPAVLAMGHGANTADCLSQGGSPSHGMAAEAHDPSHHAAMDHAATPDHHGQQPVSDHEPASDHEMSCCGLYCLNAVAVTAAAAGARPAPAVLRGRVSSPQPIVRAPLRPDRPPNGSLLA